jgi:hypothetical protein
MSRSLLILFFLLPFFAAAQPSEAEIRKQITNAGTKQIKFTKTTGTRQWNSDTGNWEWVRGVEVIRNSDYPGIDLVVTGDVVYQYTGAGKYTYWKFRTLSNEYQGIPNPTAKEIADFLSTDWMKFYGYYYNKITRLYGDPVLAEQPEWTWHSPNSVSFKMKQQFDFIYSNTEVKTMETIWNVRLYRDNPKDKWKNFMSVKSQDAREEKITGTQKFTMEQVNDLQKKTLYFTFAEQKAKQETAALPAVTLPEFKNAEEMVKYLHDLLRNGTPEKFRAVLLQLLHPGYFEEGSTVRLQAHQEQTLQQVITAVYNNKATYKMMYCQTPAYKVDQWGGGSQKKTIYITGAVNNCNSSFTIAPVSMGYKEGVAQTALKITEYGIYVRQDQDAINFVSSFSDRKKLCPND